MRLSGKSFYLSFSGMTLLRLLVHKVLGIFQRLVDWFWFLPVRIYRLLLHIGKGLRYFKWNQVHWKGEDWKQRALNKWSYWSLEFFAYLGDCFGIPELYETCIDFLKFNTRPLRDWEIELAQSVFGNAINYKRIRVDEFAFAGPRQKRFIYVSFHTINSWGPMQNRILIHELVHVWQYQQLGSVYIPRALKAQFSPEGYNYGGVKALKTSVEAGGSLYDFNLEQQSDIVMDYFLIKEGYAARWGAGKKEDLPIYEHYINTIRAMDLVENLDDIMLLPT